MPTAYAQKSKYRVTLDLEVQEDFNPHNKPISIITTIIIENLKSNNWILIVRKLFSLFTFRFFSL